MTEEKNNHGAPAKPARFHQYRSNVGLERIIQRLRNKEFMRQFGGFLLILFFTWTSSPEEFWIPFAIVAVVLGSIIRAWAAGTVFKNEILATTGPYSLIRHPLYLGNILIFVGFTLLNNEPWAWLVTVGFLWFYYPPAVTYEDGKLEDIFGQPWRDWRDKTPILIPASFKSSSLKSAWSFGLFAGRNGELLIFLFTMVCLVLAVGVR
ncbi:MAG TPA: isoprenylcysteine carboxylmethyltransferase family protein [Xanthomonadales bacterium]|nr:isoprenylcysteine carboxylmethyltransferase family protein [Xanthomonadales bacterium]